MVCDRFWDFGGLCVLIGKLSRLHYILRAHRLNFRFKILLLPVWVSLSFSVFIWVLLDNRHDFQGDFYHSLSFTCKLLRRLEFHIDTMVHCVQVALPKEIESRKKTSISYFEKLAV